MMKIDKLQLEVIIDNDEARQSLRKLEGESKRLKKELKKLPEGTDEWHRKKNKLAAIEGQMESIRHEIGLTGLSMRELSQRQRQLNAVMRNMDPRLPEYKKLQKELREVQNRQAKLRGQSRRTGSSIKQLAGNFNHYFGVVSAGIASMAGFMFGLQNMIQGSADLSDTLADVQKTTELTKNEVMELNRELMLIDTRTSRRELLELGRIAGKLGVRGIENIKGFVKEADQIVVALAEDLGGNVEETIRQVGKLVDIFGVEDDLGLDKGLRSVGSAINALGAASTANEGYLVEFSKRFGGIAPNANISIQDTLGLAATLDQLGQTTEVSTTALGKLMVLLGKDVPKYARIAGMEVADFSELLEKDANEALIKVLEGARSNKEGLEGMAEALETMGVDGQRAIGVIGVLSNNIDKLREQQELSNDEFTKATSLADEFSKKNENLAAILSKIRKRLYARFVSGSLVQALERGARVIERWTRADFEEQLEKERLQVNKLVIELNDANLKESERVKILNKLKGISPQIVEGMDAENIEVGKLVDNLEKYNAQQLKKITLSRLTDEQAKQLAEVNKLNSKQGDALNKIRGAMIEYNKEISLGNFSLEEKIDSLELILKLKAREAEQEMRQAQVIRNGEIVRTMEYQKAEDHYSELIRYISAINRYRQAGKEIEGKKGIIDDLKNQQEELKNILDFSEKIAENVNNEGFELTADKLGTESLEELRKKLELYKKALGEAQEGDDDFLRIKEKIKEVNQAIDNWNNDPKKFKYQFTFDYNDLVVQGNNIRKQVEKFLETGKTEKTPLLGQALMDLDVEDLEIDRVQTNADYYREIWEKSYEGRIAKLHEIHQKEGKSEAWLKDKVIEIEREKREAQMELTSQALGNMASVFAENTIAYKALASAQALINTYLAASKALTKGPVVGPILAATITAQGLAQVARINKIGVDKPKVSQAATGRYDVIGMDDNKLYQGVPFSSGDGILNNGKPTLINETGKEIILNDRHVKNIEMNYPDVEQAIKATYVPQRATGNYQPIERSQPAPAAQQAAPVMDERMVDLLERNTAAMEKISKEGVRGRWVYRDFEDFQNEVETTKKTASRE